MYHVLVCDDDKEIVEAISIYLMTEGYEVFKAYDGMEALAILKKEEIHLLLIDIMMPKMDGIHATMKLREQSNIPVIILSAKSEDADKILGLNIGADDYITKPFPRAAQRKSMPAADGIRRLNHCVKRRNRLRRCGQ